MTKEERRQKDPALLARLSQSFLHQNDKSEQGDRPRRSHRRGRLPRIRSRSVTSTATSSSSSSTSTTETTSTADDLIKSVRFSTTVQMIESPSYCLLSSSSPSSSCCPTEDQSSSTAVKMVLDDNCGFNKDDCWYNRDDLNSFMAEIHHTAELFKTGKLVPVLEDNDDIVKNNKCCYTLRGIEDHLTGRKRALRRHRRLGAIREAVIEEQEYQRRKTTKLDHSMFMSKMYQSASRPLVEYALQVAVLDSYHARSTSAMMMSPLGQQEQGFYPSIFIEKSQ